jgi:hypothetical protein
MNKEELISKKVRGFKFKGEIGRIMFNSSMKDTIGEVGTIIEYDKKFNTFQVNFRDSSWFYPAELIEQHLVEEINHVKIISNKEILNERIEKTKNTLTYSAALYQDGVILSNQIAIMEALIAIQDSIVGQTGDTQEKNK